MTDYKATLNLPKTDFPMKANLANREPARLEKWQTMNLYQLICEQSQGLPNFILHDGPPYANGDIHLGHAVNKVLKDIVCKSKRLSGFASQFVPGWDCHGLPIELNVEKKLGKVGDKITAQQFRQACRDYAKTQVQRQSVAFQRLGVLGEWDNPYLTMNSRYEASIINALKIMIEKGHLHQGYKPVHWCTSCGSALAEAEVEYKDKKSPSIDVRFSFTDEALLWQRCHHTLDAEHPSDIAAVIWTTTPWTLPANQAVAVNPSHDYVIVKTNLPSKSYLLVSDELLKDTMSRYQIEDYRVIAYCHGNKLEGLHLQHPFLNREVPIVLGEHVTLDAGTGAVHTAPAHGADDFIMAKRYDLPVSHHVLPNGCFDEKTKHVANLHVFKANDVIIDLLKTHGNLIHMETVEHSYPHCWRHKTPLIFRATPQWFVSMHQKSLEENALGAIEKIQWHPEWGEKRMHNMIKDRPDWCISRQREWGVPIPLFVHKKTGKLHPDMLNLFDQIIEQISEKGLEIWFDSHVQDWLSEDEAKHYEKSQDILDVWFDAGVSHTAVLTARDLPMPADLYLEGSDQYRGWFQTALLTSIALYDQAPYKAVLTHGFTTDDKGRKMSKSLGNVISPDQIIKTAGADMLRLWVATTDYRGELVYSQAILQQVSDLYRRIRNTARYLLANTADFNMNVDQVAYDELLDLDKWILARAGIVQNDIINAYDEYQYHLVCQTLQHFCSIDLGSFYLDIIKDRQYTLPKNSLARRSAQTVMAYVASALTRWIAPILSFTADEIFEYLPYEVEKSVFLSRWSDQLKPMENSHLSYKAWENLILLRDEINKVLEQARMDKTIGSALAASVTIYVGNAEYTHLLESVGSEFRFVLITSEVVFKFEKASERAIKTAIPGISVMVEGSGAPKCERCWHHRSDVDADPQFPGLCARCINNIDGDGESRQFA